MSLMLHRIGILEQGSGGGGGSLSAFSGDLATRPWFSSAVWPGAIYSVTADKTYLAWRAETPPQTAKIAAYDHATETWSEPVVIDSLPIFDDDHPQVALVELSDGRLAAFYGNHNSDQQWSLSDASGGVPDITTWTRQVALGANSTYPHPVNVPDGSGGGTLYLIRRQTVGNPVNNLPLILSAATYTSGGPVSFDPKITLVDLDGGGGARVYAHEVRVDASDNIEILATRANLSDTTRQHVYYFKVITATLAVENLSGGTSTPEASLPIDLTLANSDYREVTSAGSNITGAVSWARDANGALHITYGDADVTVDSLHAIKHNVHSGGSWGTATTAFSVVNKGQFVEEWTIAPGGSGDRMEGWYPQGNTNAWPNRVGDNLARKVYSSGAWGSEEIIITGDGSRAWGVPTSVLNGHSNFRIAATQITQSRNTVDAEAVKRIGHGDGGFIEWPALTDPSLYTNALLLGFEGSDAATTTSDESSWAHLHPVTFNGNARIDTAQAKFGSSSLKLDGAGDYLTIPRSRGLGSFGGHEFRFHEGTIEGFVRLNELGRLQALLVTRVSTNTVGFQLYISSGNVLGLVVWNGSAALFNITGTTTMTTGQWYYFAAKRTGNTYSIHLDGITEASTTAGSTPDEGGQLFVGRTPTDAGLDFNGWLDEIRWTKRLLRDVSSVPTAAFPRS